MLLRYFFFLRFSNKREKSDADYKADRYFIIILVETYVTLPSNEKMSFNFLKIKLSMT